MRVVLSQPQNFKKALTLLNAVVKSKVDPFRWVKLRADDKHQFELQGTNGEVYLTIRIPAEIEEEGEACVELAPLIEAIKPVKAKYNVELYTENEKLELAIKTGSLTQILALRPVEMFPQFPNSQFQASMPAVTLLQGIEKTGFAIRRDKSVLGHLYIDGRGTRIIGSDCHRLAVLKFDGYAFDSEVKLYHKSLKILKALLKDFSNPNELVHIGYGESKLAYITNRSKLTYLTNGTWVIAIRDFASEEKYPNFVIPPDDTYDIVVEFKIDDLNNALKHFTKSDRITLEFFAPDFFTIKSGYKLVFVKARVHGLNLPPDDVFLSDVGFCLDFNPRQLIEFTKAARKDSYVIEARFKDNDRVPALFKVNDDYLYLVMPLKFERR